MTKKMPRTGPRCWCVCAVMACGSDPAGDRVDGSSTPSDTPQEQPSPPSTTTPEPGSQPVSETGICNNLLNASDIPFATAVFAITDACPSQRRGAAPVASSTIADVRREAPGKYCVSGVLTNGFANLVVSFDHINDMPTPPFHGPLDAAALGVTQFRFTVESAPGAGFQLSPSNVVRDECPVSSDECIQSGFYLLDGAGTPTTITQAGTYTQRIADLRPGPGLAPTLTLDAQRLAGLQFELDPGAIDLCVSDIQLLDDGANPVVDAE
jgi:hypothetical protein